MKRLDPILRIYMKSIIATMVAMITISTVISLVAVYPFYSNLATQNEKDFLRFEESLHNQIKSHLSELTNIALQVTSRTKARAESGVAHRRECLRWFGGRYRG